MDCQWETRVGKQLCQLNCCLKLEGKEVGGRARVKHTYYHCTCHQLVCVSAI